MNPESPVNADVNASRRGSALLLCLGVLALLSLLGTTLIFISRSEQRAAQDYMDHTRAQLAADSGVELSLAKLLSYSGPLNGLPTQFQTLPATPTTPLRHLSQSSYGTQDTDGDGKNDVAGYVSETYTTKGDTYRLRVVSEQSKLNLNDPNSQTNIDTDPFEDQRTPERIYTSIPRHLRAPTSQDPDWIYTPGDTDHDTSFMPQLPCPRDPGRLYHIIDSLVSVLFPYNPLIPITDPGYNAPNLGKNAAKALLSARKQMTGDRFSNMDQIHDALVPKVFNEERYNLLSCYFTLHSWQDKSVLRPTFQWRISTPTPTTPGDMMSAHSSLYLGDYTAESSLLWWNWDYMVQPAPRPTLTGTISHDFNSDGTIQAFNPSTPYAYHEELRNDYDIYQYIDMQTRFFALDTRCPVDINNARIELIEALIRPIRGWYLKEAPSTWEGEPNDARVEDWSQHRRDNPPPSASYAWQCGHPFTLDQRGGIEEEPPSAPGYIWQDFEAYPEHCQYYYYDAYNMQYLDLCPSPFAYPSTGEPGFPQFCVESPLKSSRYGELKETKLFDQTLGATGKTVARHLAEALWNRIHKDSDGDGIDEVYAPFQTWEEFEQFIRNLAIGTSPLTGVAKDFDIYMADAIIANFNPNSRINDYAPNKRLFLHVDKSQLMINTTEFCFHPMGFFRIESLGEVRGAGVSGVTTMEIQSYVQTHSIFRVTQQSDFLKGYTDPTFARTCFSESNGSNTTAGAATGFQGLSIQSYPEPLVNSTNLVQNSVYDGFLMLATNKPDRTDQFNDPSAAANNIFYDTFDQALTADFSAGSANPKATTGPKRWTLNPWRVRFLRWAGAYEYRNDTTFKVPTNNLATDALTRDVSNLVTPDTLADFPGALYPDGVISTVGQSPEFETLNNIGDSAVQGKRGSVQYWIKPNFDVAHSNRIRTIFSAPPRSRNPMTIDPLLAIDGFASHKDFKYYFQLSYLGHGGRRVPKDPSTGDLDDDNYLSYNPDQSITGGRWANTRSFFMFAGDILTPVSGGGSSYGRYFGIGTESANQSWRDYSADPAAWSTPYYNFETRQWSHISFGWDWEGIRTSPLPMIEPVRYFYLSVNGQNVEAMREQRPPFYAWANGASWTYAGYFGAGARYPLRLGIQTDDFNNSNYMRFGDSSEENWNNHVADSLFDDIVSSKIQHGDPNLPLEFGYGRYYEEDDAVYSSPSINIFSAIDASVNSLELLCAEWTAYWCWSPNNALAPDRPLFNDNLESNNSSQYNTVLAKAKTDTVFPADPMVSFWGSPMVPFSLDVFDPSAGAMYYASLPAVEKPNFAGGSRDPQWNNKPILYKRGGTDLKFKVHFNMLGGQTLFTSPIFDDVTFVFLLDKALVLEWQIK